MANEINSIYINNPEAYEVFVDQSLFASQPISNTETDASIYAKEPTSIDVHVDQTLYGGKNVKELNNEKIKKNTTTITAIAATLLASAVGVIGIVNPLLTRPTISNGSYQVVDNALNYKFNFNSTSNYSSSLLLYLNEEVIETVQLGNTKIIEGSITLTDHGNYHLDIYSTNNIDYRKQTVLYTFTY